MTDSNHQLARRFIEALPSGEIPEDLLAPDMTMWTTTSGTSERERVLGGLKLLASIVSGQLTYRIESLTAEEDRVVAEVQSSGTLINGEPIQNNHVFIFRIRDGRIASLAEHMNPDIVREKIAPLMQAAMAGDSK